MDMKIFILIIVLISFYIYYQLDYTKKYFYECNSKNTLKRNARNIWNYGNYIDLGANNGDSIAWFYNIYISNLKSIVPYPKIVFNISKNFNTFIFEANPFMCNKIYRIVEYIKKHRQLYNFYIYCPVIVSTYDGIDIMSIDKDDISSSKFYESNIKYNNYRRNFTIPVINFTHFLQENIPFNDFNVMKFDIEGEEHFVIPQLMKRKLITKFDILYSEFHTDSLNNPVKERGINIYNKFLSYTDSYGIDIYEERKMTKYSLDHHLDIYNELVRCRKDIFFHR